MYHFSPISSDFLLPNRPNCNYSLIYGSFTNYFNLPNGMDAHHLNRASPIESLNLMTKDTKDIETYDEKFEDPWRNKASKGLDLYCPICSKRLKDTVRPMEHFNQELEEYRRRETLKAGDEYDEDQFKTQDYCSSSFSHNSNFSSRHQTYMKIRSNRSRRTGKTFRCQSPASSSSPSAPSPLIDDQMNRIKGSPRVEDMST